MADQPSSNSVCDAKSSLEKIFIDGEDQSIILNPNFDDGLNNWSAWGSCKLALHDSMGDGQIGPFSGHKYFAAASERTQSWNGIQQEITGRVQRKLAYEATAFVRVFANPSSSSAAPSAPAEVRTTLYVQAANGREQYVGIAKAMATDKDWVQLKGKFLMNGEASKIVVFVEGPPAGMDILLGSLVIKHAEKAPPSSPPDFENVTYGVNIIQNGSLSDGSDGLSGWFPLGPCKLAVVASGAPRVLPTMARDSLGTREPLNGRHIHVTDRTQTWMGPAQTITERIQIHVAYQVSAWVRVVGAQGTPQNVNVALGVDTQWVNCGQSQVTDGRWYEIGGSFRIETLTAERVMVYVQGPAAGVDLMVAGLQIFPVDRKARFRHLKNLTDKVRKRDVVLKITASDNLAVDSALPPPLVRVRQIKNSFPFGSCIARSNIDNEDFVNFFVTNFNWAVFENELKWYWTEPQQGSLNYADADELLDLCKKNGIETRGHCIFWEVESAVQGWVRALNNTDLASAVQSRLNGLLTRYKDQFQHYDVNNEMLHGTFYQDRLGRDIRSSMFKAANQLDSAATLFVNDYNVECAADTRATPETYIEQILSLQDQGAPVGGIGLQGHVKAPVGPVISSALDKLGVLGIPVWFTEIDVSAANEFVRADDLEVILREAYAHPAVEGVMLWGFWELFMSRDDAHLVNAEGDLNEAGRRLSSLLQHEWTSRAHGRVDGQGEFKFRGFHGTYSVEIRTLTKKVRQTFTVDKGDSPLVVEISL
ncbi:endo-1,4-beta-xylanase 1-like [Zingiber officinale]|uniref:GH10 domain-containing protein n=1 Tax=Zingiber officinale TaxID=94328 RepID=A0A8J5KWK8_ZINOF|nr:endo-1,4-beta-xylanase 1-like [Zingiber officinale]KAG6492319.1 hypothetical protein ZIOFF_047273 [Zingiber officinale]